MARIRTIKPEFFQDTELSDLPIHTRYFFIGLWTQADREGRLEDNPKRLKIQLMPWDDVDCEKMLTELSGHFITRFLADGKKYIQINSFSKHQRPHMHEPKSTIPDASTTIVGSSTTIVGSSMLGREGKGREGKGKEGKVPPGVIPDIDGLDCFGEFWQIYPNHDAQLRAENEWINLMPEPELVDTILADVRAKAKSEDWKKEGGKFVPLAANYLKDQRWMDKKREKPQFANSLEYKNARDGYGMRLLGQGMPQDEVMRKVEEKFKGATIG